MIHRLVLDPKAKAATFEPELTRDLDVTEGDENISGSALPGV